MSGANLYNKERKGTLLQAPIVFLQLGIHIIKDKRAWFYMNQALKNTSY
jgi:hypothetical protein